MIFGHYWWLMVPGFLLGIYAQFKLSSTYGKYLEVANVAGLSGEEAAREILDRAGLRDIPIDEVPGRLSDHFDPSKRVLSLSPENFEGRSLASIGVAAHEAGHALQQRASYPLLALRSFLVPAVQIASMAWMGFFLLGICFGLTALVNVGVVVFSVMTLFQLVTLPVEFDASRRAKQQLLKLGLIQPAEAQAINRVLNAAAMTYVAGMVSAGLQLLQFLLMARDQDRG